MRVNLLAYTPEPERIVATAARVCYSDKPIDEIFTNAAHNSEKFEIIRRCRDNGHLSVFEHACFTFAIEGISRACSHQLVRHRMASYSQKSQRYVEESEFDYIIPESVRLDKWELHIYENVMGLIRQEYDRLIKGGIPKEDARYILPNACTTQLVVTMNARELLHFFRLRCCQRAQWEIRELANEMLELCRRVAPVLFEKAGAPCETGEECKEEEPCKENQDAM